MDGSQADAAILEETPEEAAAAILPALKYLSGEAERAGLGQLARAIDRAAETAAAETIPARP